MQREPKQFHKYFGAKEFVNEKEPYFQYMLNHSTPKIWQFFSLGFVINDFHWLQK